MWWTARVLCADRWWLRVNENTNIVKLFLSRHQFHKTHFEKGRGAPIHKGSQISMKISTPQCNVGLKQKMPSCSTVTFTLQVQLLQLWKLRMQKLRRNLPGLHQFCHQHHHHQKFKSPRNVFELWKFCHRFCCTSSAFHSSAVNLFKQEN